MNFLRVRSLGKPGRASRVTKSSVTIRPCVIRGRGFFEGVDSVIPDSYICKTADNLDEVPRSLTLLGQLLVEGIHNLGIPWWGSIVVLSFCVRAILLPFQAAQIRNATVSLTIRDDLASVGLIKDFKMQQEKRNEILIKNGLSLDSQLINGLIQAPMLIYPFITLRTMAQWPAYYNEFAHGGFWIFSDLTAVSPAIAVLSTITFMVVFYIMPHVSGGTTLNPRIMVPMVVVVFLISLFQPIAVHIYWISSAVFLSMSALLYIFPKIRDVIGVPRLVENPYAPRKKRNFLLKYLYSVLPRWRNPPSTMTQSSTPTHTNSPAKSNPSSFVVDTTRIFEDKRKKRRK